MFLFSDSSRLFLGLQPCCQARSMANHSCLPNALVLKCGEALLLRARRVISQGEEVCINYFDVLKPLAERQKLCQSWGFVCECPRCEDERSIDESKFRAISILMNQLRSPLAAAPPGAAPLQEGSAEAIADHLKVVEAVLPGSFSHCKLCCDYTGRRIVFFWTKSGLRPKVQGRWNCAALHETALGGRVGSDLSSDGPQAALWGSRTGRA
eukprot:s2237_g1.t1